MAAANTMIMIMLMMMMVMMVINPGNSGDWSKRMKDAVRKKFLTECLGVFQSRRRGGAPKGMACLTVSLLNLTPRWYKYIFFVENQHKCGNSKLLF